MPAYLPARLNPTYVATPSGWDDTWKAARAAAGSSPARVLAFGDSFTSGSAASDFNTKSWPALLQTILGARYGYGGDFWPISLSQAYGTDIGGFTYGGTPPVALDKTGGNAWFLRTPYYTYFWTATNNAAMATFTTPYACTTLDILTYDNPSAVGTFTISVDGGANQTVTTSPTPGFGWVRKTTITGLTNTTHTVVVNGQSAANVFALVGFTTYKSTTSGILMARAGYSAMDLGAIGPTTAGGQDSTLFWQGKQGTTTVSAASNASPIVITTTTAHEYQTGAKVSIASVAGNTAANNTSTNPAWTVTRLSSTTFSLQGSVGNGAYTSGGTVTSVSGLGFPTQPHLAIVNFGINDCRVAGGVQKYRRTLIRCIQAMRRGVDRCSIIVATNSNPDGVSSDVPSGGTFANPESWNLYLEAARDVADYFGCAHVNFHALWGEHGVTRGYQTTTNAHPLDAGHQNMADVFSAMVA